MAKYIPPNSNRFASLDENNPRPLTTTTTGVMSSGTMASLTRASIPSSSYASRFSEQARLRNDPKYVPPKSVNIASNDDFPTLGVPKVAAATNLPKSSTGQNFIQMAEGWGKKIEIEEKENRDRIYRAEEDRRAQAKIKIKPETIQLTTKNKIILQTKDVNRFYDEKEKRFKKIEGDISDDSFESGPHEEEEVDDDCESQDDEFNTNIVNDRRHRDELY